jgi:Tol biopolymer transport system component
MKTQFDPHEFFVAGGTLWREAPSYVVRPADEELLQLSLAGEYCNVLASRQMGKSSLMVRTANHLQQAGVKTSIIDISVLGGGISTPDAWFFGFLDELAVQLDLTTDVGAWWEEHTALNAVQRFSNFLRDVLLVEIQASITVFVDEIDSALGMAFTDDFFAAIRAAYNARANNPEFQRLTFVLVGVARPADLIRDRNRTPYNIGTHITLTDFDLAELLPFQAVLEEAHPGQGGDIIRWVLAWTNGQPYLTQKMCLWLIQEPASTLTQESISQTVKRLFFADEARKESNLRAIRDRIESSPYKIKMLQVYQQVLRGKSVLDEERSPEKNELKLTGLLRTSVDGQLEIRNRIYTTVFDRQWIRKNLPVSRPRWIAILMSLLAVLAIFVAGYAIYKQRLQPSLTFTEQFETSNSPDVKLTSLARLFELDERSAAQAYALYSGIAQNHKEDLFTTLSDPQNVSEELVTVIEAVYQGHKDTPEDNHILSAMKDVLGQIGAEGAPGLKTELEFWLKGREEASDVSNYQIAVSFYDGAWAESEARGHPNFSIRFDRAMALIEGEEFALALTDLQAVWKQDAAREEEISAVINAHPALAYYGTQNASSFPAMSPFITPVMATATENPTHTPTAEPTPLPTSTPTPEAYSPYTGWAAYAYGEEGIREITLMNPDSGETRQITSNEVMDEAPCFSPDNWKMVYASNRSPDGWELYLFDLEKGTEQQLTTFDGQARFPVWSPVPGDSRIVFEGRGALADTERNIWMVDVNTGEIEQITTGGADGHPTWSPDGSQIIFGRATIDTTGEGKVTTADNLDIYLLDLTTRTEVNLTNTPAYDDFQFDWSPDGDWIVFTSVRQDANGDGVTNLSDSIDLFMLRADGSEERTLDLGGKGVFSPSWSPDGGSILVLVFYGDEQNEIWRFDVDSGEMEPITDRGAYFHPSYSHASSTVEQPPTPLPLNDFELAFVSDRDGDYAVYLMDTLDVSNWVAIPRPTGYERVWWPTFCDTHVAFEVQDAEGLKPQWVYYLTPEGSEPIEYRSSLDAARLGVPRCSPDGETMAYSIHIPVEYDGWQLAINDTQNRNEYVLSQNPSFGYVTWSNREDFFLSMTIIGEDFYILETTNFRGDMALSTIAKGKYPALSPNGNRFVFLCSNQNYLCIKSLDREDLKALVPVVSFGLAGESIPVTAMWSKDGQWIYFASAEDGDWDIYRVRPDGSDLLNLTAEWDSNEMMPALNWQP